MTTMATLGDTILSFEQDTGMLPYASMYVAVGHLLAQDAEGEGLGCMMH